MNGLLLIDKPIGITSFDCIRRLREALIDPSASSGRSTKRVLRIGHAGTLDPLASGLMLILFGSACKQAMSLTKLDKTYLAELTLGANSTTGDAEGDKLAISSLRPALDVVLQSLAGFEGEITQTPSAYSAIKINGQEAYKRIRRGEKVLMPSRKVSIRTIKLLNYNYPRLEVATDVSSGTYIRSLAEDIGAALGTGAFLSALQRTRVGEYKLENAIKLTEVTPDLVNTSLIDLG